MSEETPHIVIVGAGLIGLCTAHFLREKDAKVTVIDAKDGPCQGASFSNSGMIHPSQARSWNTTDGLSDDSLQAARAVVALGKQSVELLRPLMQSLGLPKRREGCVQIYPTLDAARTAQKDFTAIGVRADILLDPLETLNQPACLFPDDISGNARNFGFALAKRLAENGVAFFYGVDNFAIRDTDGGRQKIMAGDRRLTCDHVIVATGAQTKDVLARLDLRLQLESVSGMAINFKRPSNSQALPSRPVMDVLSRSALTAFEDCVRISGGWNLTQPETLLERWQDIAPQILEDLGETVSTWTGYRPVTSVGRPYISATSRPGLWLNTGHGHMGWTLCAASGQLMAEMILEGRKDDRFTFLG